MVFKLVDNIWGEATGRNEARRAAEEIIKDIIEDFQVYIYNLELFEAGEDGLVAEMDSQNDWLISFDYVRSLYIK